MGAPLPVSILLPRAQGMDTMPFLMSVEIKTNDLRRYAIQTRSEVTYRVRSSGQTAVMNPKGIIQIPGISGRPAYNVEDVLQRADEFVLNRPEEKSRTLTREAMAELLKQAAPAPAAAAKEE